MADHLLDITTLTEQPTIKISGVQYQIAHPDQLGVIDFQRLAKMAARVSDLMNQPDHSDADARDVTKIITDLTDRIMVGVPADVRSLLTESQRLAVAEVFMTLPTARTRKARATKGAKANRSGGSKPRSGASASTAEIQPDG